MDKKSRIFLIVLLLLVIVSIYLTYRRSFITKDYEIIVPEDTQTDEGDLNQ